jgi:hypothetical protein
MEENCRLCRRRTDEFAESVFNFRDGIQNAEIISKICPIPIPTEEDELPKQLCDECVEVLESAYQLQKVSIESDKHYRLHNTKPEYFEEEFSFIIKSESADEFESKI